MLLAALLDPVLALQGVDDDARGLGARLVGIEAFVGEQQQGLGNTIDHRRRLARRFIELAREPLQCHIEPNPRSDTRP